MLQKRCDSDAVLEQRFDARAASNQQAELDVGRLRDKEANANLEWSDATGRRGWWTGLMGPVGAGAAGGKRRGTQTQGGRRKKKPHRSGPSPG